MKTCILAMTILVASSTAFAAPASYTLDPMHTFPSFEADHMGISTWRGKFNKSAGTLLFDKATGKGSVEVTIDLDSIDFGLDALNTWAAGDEFFNIAKYPQARFKGELTGLLPDAASAQAAGELTLHGVTRPLVLQIRSFKCIEHPAFKRDYCGADATATFNRDDFGLDAGKAYGFRMDVNLRIQVEALIDTKDAISSRNPS
jgi:polyisoprenoid-binding protein YceI